MSVGDDPEPRLQRRGRVRRPTEKQYRLLLALGSGAIQVLGTKRETEPLLRHGWVTAELKEDKSYPYAWVRITPNGLRALAIGVENYGLPEIWRKQT